MSTICDALRNLAPFVQFEKRGKQPWRCVALCKVSGFRSGLNSDFTQSNTPPWVFFMILRFYKWYKITQSISYQAVHSA